MKGRVKVREIECIDLHVEECYESLVQNCLNELLMMIENEEQIQSEMSWKQIVSVIEEQFKSLCPPSRMRFDEIVSELESLPKKKEIAP